MVRKVLLLCGIASSLFYGVMMTAIRYEGYSAMSQTVSELTAIGAPTRSLWALLGPWYDVLIVAFGIGVWMSAEGNRALRVVGGLLVGFGIAGGVLWPLASMHQREVLAAGGGTASDLLHIVLGILTVVFMLTTTGIGAVALGRRFRLYSIATIVTALVFGILMSIEGPNVKVNQPTPFIGLWERINIAVFLLWIAVLAIALLRAPERAWRGETTREARSTL